MVNAELLKLSSKNLKNMKLDKNAVDQSFDSLMGKVRHVTLNEQRKSAMLLSGRIAKIEQPLNLQDKSKSIKKVDYSNNYIKEY